MSGSKINIWKQDPLISVVGIRPTYIHSEVKEGLYDSQLKIMGIEGVKPTNRNNDYLFDPRRNSLEFDAAHTFAVTRQVLTVVERALRRLGWDNSFKWQWGEGPIRIFPRIKEETNAYYIRSRKLIGFGYFKALNSSSYIYTCRSYDVVSHELGHAILDALKPSLWASDNPQTGGLHESFGDLLALFTLLAQLDMCEIIIAESKGNLHNRTFFTIIAEQMGQNIYKKAVGLRNVDNNITLENVDNEVHAMSLVFTGAMYDILSDMFEYHKDLEKYDPAETLYRVGQHLLELLLLTINKVQPINTTYLDMANTMIEVEKDPKFKEIIKESFTARKIFVKKVEIVSPIIDLSNACETLQRRK